MKISAILCAYNEGERIEKVLEILTSYFKFEDIIIVNDGYTDNTDEKILKFTDPRIKYLKNEKNMGKGFSMDRAMEEAASNIIFFADADIKGLSHNHIDKILEPVITQEKDMCIGMRDRNIYAIPGVLKYFTPLLGGERAIIKDLWKKIPYNYKRRFQIEVALNFYAKYFGKGYTYFTINVRHLFKEKKYGFIKGSIYRIWMYFDMIFAYFNLYSKFLFKKYFK